MNAPVSAKIVASEYGQHPSILSLNKSLRPGSATLRLVLEIDWDPPEPSSTLSELEARLSGVCPSLRQHVCRGPAQYHVQALSRPASAAARLRRTAIEPALALAHLIEHVMIDAVAFVTGAPRVSGVTGGHKNSMRLFDVYVECPDANIAAFARYVGIHWVLGSASGTSLEAIGAPTLRVARLVYGRRPRALQPGCAAEALGIHAECAGGILDTLEAAGFVGRVPYTVNISGGVHYAVSAPQPEPPRG